MAFQIEILHNWMLDGWMLDGWMQVDGNSGPCPFAWHYTGKMGTGAMFVLRNHWRFCETGGLDREGTVHHQLHRDRIIRRTGLPVMAIEPGK
jgi:hypothetical protein